MTYQAICSQVGCSPATITAALRAAGIPLKAYNTAWREALHRQALYGERARQNAIRELETAIAEARADRENASIFKLPASETFRPRFKD